jgi:hypothetical protein
VSTQAAIATFAAILKTYGIDLHTFRCQTWGDPGTDEPMLFKFTNAAGALIAIDEVYLDRTTGDVVQHSHPSGLILLSCLGQLLWLRTLLHSSGSAAKGFDILTESEIMRRQQATFLRSTYV